MTKQTIWTGAEAAAIVVDMDSMRQDAGQRLREIRRALGMTQEQFAEAGGVSQQTVSQFERGLAGAAFTIMGAIKDAGGDPMDLWRDAPAADATVAEIRELLPGAPASLLAAILMLLRQNQDEAAGRSAK